MQLVNKKFHIVKNADSKNKAINTFQSLEITQKDDTLKGSNVSLPSDDNVDEAKDWVDFNKK